MQTAIHSIHAALTISAAKKQPSVAANTQRDIDDSTDAKRQALEGVLHSIERAYGRGSIQKLGSHEAMQVEVISTGCITLDAALGGGLPKGRVVEIFGPESSGKTTLALHAIAEVQKNGGMAAFVDAEHALDPAYAARLGVKIDDLLVCQPDSGEMALDVVDQLVRSAAVECVVIDSVAALVPRQELENELGDAQMGLQARLMSKAMRKITGSLSKSQCTVVFLNQLRSKIGVMFGSPEVTSGGNALKYYSSVRIDIRRREILKDNTGISVRTKIVKNKVAPPFRVVEFDILFGSGIDKYGALLDAAESAGVVIRKGSWYAYNEQKFAQGKSNACEILRNDPSMFEEMDRKTRGAIFAPGGKSIVEFKLELPNTEEDVLEELPPDS